MALVVNNTIQETTLIKRNFTLKRVRVNENFKWGKLDCYLDINKYDLYQVNIRHYFKDSKYSYYTTKLIFIIDFSEFIKSMYEIRKYVENYLDNDCPNVSIEYDMKEFIKKIKKDNENLKNELNRNYKMKKN